jgi:hypothetical protein
MGWWSMRGRRRRRRHKLCCLRDNKGRLIYVKRRKRFSRRHRILEIWWSILGIKQ